MYCPSCGTQNIESAQFCRGCGENISLVPQALAGQLPENRAVGYDVEGKSYDAAGRRLHREKRQREREKEPPRLDRAVSTAFGGLAFLLIALILLFTQKADWWYWLLIPAFAIIGNGLAEYVRYKQAEKGEAVPDAPSKSRARVSAVAPPPSASALPPRNTSELVPPPPSVTEGTTRHLNIKAEAPINKRAENQERET